MGNGSKSECLSALNPDYAIENLLRSEIAAKQVALLEFSISP